MLAVLSDENLLTHILQSVEGERRKLQKRIAETNDKESKGSIDAMVATTQRQDLESALKDLYQDRILQLMLAKPVSCFWRRVCRNALTDMEWHKADYSYTLENMMHCNNMTWRLPLRCTLHPRLSPFDTSSSGFFRGKLDDPNPGNPCNSVLGTLRDLQVRAIRENGDIKYDILHMELEIDGLEGSFDSVWSPLASKFHITRNDLYWDNKRNKDEMKDELDFITIGHVLQNRYWIELSTICEVRWDAAFFHHAFPDWRQEQYPAQILPSRHVPMEGPGLMRVDGMEGPGLMRKDGSPCVVY